MKANQKYFLNRNLDLKGENFLVKKGTQLEVVSLFDQTDKNIETKVNVKFDKVNGNYLIDETDFKEHIDNKTLEKIDAPKFEKGACVIHSEKGRGVVKDYWFDSFGEFYIYVVTISNVDYKTLEDNLTSC